MSKAREEAEQEKIMGGEGLEKWCKKGAEGQEKERMRRSDGGGSEEGEELRVGSNEKMRRGGT